VSAIHADFGWKCLREGSLLRKESREHGVLRVGLKAQQWIRLLERGLERPKAGSMSIKGTDITRELHYLFSSTMVGQAG